jgi:hypothetical protein
MLWTDGEMIDLHSLFDPATLRGWVLNGATDINDQGWIVGYMHNSISNEDHAFLLTPSNSIPEPGTAFLLGLGLATFTWSRRSLLGVHIASSFKRGGRGELGTRWFYTSCFWPFPRIYAGVSNNMPNGK